MLKLTQFRSTVPVVISCLLLPALCGCGPDNPFPASVPRGLIVLGAVDFNSDPPVQIEVLFDGKPVTDAQVTLNGIDVPFTGTVDSDGVTDAFYTLPDVAGAPGTSYTLNVRTSHGDKAFQATMPDAPVVTSPAANAVYHDSQSIAVAWTHQDGVARFNVGLLPSYGMIFPKYDHVAGSGTQFSIPSGKTTPMSLDQTVLVGAMSGQGEYLYENIVTANPPEGFFAVNWTAVNVKIIP